MEKIEFENRTELKGTLHPSAMFAIAILLKEYVKEQLRPLLNRKKSQENGKRIRIENFKGASGSGTM